MLDIALMPAIGNFKVIYSATVPREPGILIWLSFAVNGHYIIGDGTDLTVRATVQERRADRPEAASSTYPVKNPIHSLI